MHARLRNFEANEGIPLRPRPDPKALLREEAANWVVRIVSDPRIADDPAFLRWRQRGQGHEQAFADAHAAWGLAAEVGVTIPSHQLQKRRSLFSGMFRPLTACLAMTCLVLCGFWLDTVRPDLRSNLGADHSAPRGPARTITLADGTGMVLDGGSALDFNEDDLSRRVVIRSGAAFFDVKKDGRPFSVRFGNHEVRALGTRFEMRDCGGCLLVTLEEGSVEVLDAGSRHLVLLHPGQQLRLPANDGATAPVAVSVDMREALAWRDGRYTFHEVSLGEVAGVLQRHGVGMTFFANDALARRPVTGSIDLDNAAVELDALAEALGFRLVPLPGGYLAI